MKRSQLESREQMTYAEPERRIVEVQRSKVSFPILVAQNQR